MMYLFTWTLFLELHLKLQKVYHIISPQYIIDLEHFYQILGELYLFNINQLWLVLLVIWQLKQLRCLWVLRLGIGSISNHKFWHTPPSPSQKSNLTKAQVYIYTNYIYATIFHLLFIMFRVRLCQGNFWVGTDPLVKVKSI